tara:strand:+ start:559 stop:1443 length:885 start_codon:yes stop_codon:yes gene_type:complete
MASNLKKTPIILGTAQIIDDYGITNRSTKTRNDALIFIQDIIKLGITVFDTAKKYKGAHEVLQKSIKKDFKKFTIIDKISKKDILSIKKNFFGYWDWVNKFQSLGGNFCVMLHNGVDYLDIECRKNIQKLKEKGLARFIGISVYEPSHLKKALDLGGFDIVQFPLSLADRRFCELSLVNKLNKMEVMSHVRSVFLQGLLLSNTSKDFYFQKDFKIAYQKYDQKFPSFKKKVFLAIQSVVNDIVASIVIGAESIKQVNDIINAYHSNDSLNKNDLLQSRKIWSHLPKDAVDPRKW